jgi:nucleoside phosphorylase
VKTVVRIVAVAAAASCLVVPTASASRILLLSAYPAEQAVLLQAVAPYTEVDAGPFNLRRFFRGTVSGHEVVLGLTGIGLNNAVETTTEVLTHFGDAYFHAIVFSGVANGNENIGDVRVAHSWRRGPEGTPIEVDTGLEDVARCLAGDDLGLNPYLPVEDVSCTGQHDLLTPVRVKNDPQLRFGGLGQSADPYGEDRMVPCISSGGGLEGCEACGAPLNDSPDVAGFVAGSAPFFPPFFLFDLFAPPAPSDPPPDIVDMETAGVAEVAAAARSGLGIPFIAFRAFSDSNTGGGDPLRPDDESFPNEYLAYQQFFVYQQLAADNAAKVTLAFLAALAGAESCPAD